MGLRALASFRGGITSVGSSKTVSIASTASVRGVIMGLGWWVGNAMPRGQFYTFLTIIGYWGVQRRLRDDRARFPRP